MNDVLFPFCLLLLIFYEELKMKTRLLGTCSSTVWAVIGESDGAPFYDHDGGISRALSIFQRKLDLEQAIGWHQYPASWEWNYHVCLGIYLAATQSPTLLLNRSTGCRLVTFHCLLTCWLVDPLTIGKGFSAADPRSSHLLYCSSCIYW